METEFSIAFVGTYYSPFLEAHYRDHPGLISLPYQTQLDALLGSSFGDSDFYSNGMRHQGWRAYEIIANCAPLQKMWAQENNAPDSGLQTFVQQLAALKPDVVYFHDISLADSTVTQQLKGLVRLIVGQIASPVPRTADLPSFDLIVSSFPHFVDAFQRAGIRSLYQPLAFDPRVLSRLGPRNPKYAATFIGGVTGNHQARINLLSSICSGTKLDTWGYGYNQLPADSNILRNYHGETWGHAMFTELRDSYLTLNSHIDVASTFANNMRLFEATGCGTLLLTEERENLGTLFRANEEVITYRSIPDCADKIQYFLRNERESTEIAHAGQRRTLSSHTYLARMAQTASVLRENIFR
jgi:hypothetical protein